jgi:hypothetical protein
MKVPWPITVLASILAFGLLTVVTVMDQLQSVPKGPAPTWPSFVLTHAPFVVIGTAVVGLVAWVVERNVRRSRVAG